MTIEEALVVIDTYFKQKRLSNLQELVLRQCWEGQTYSEIAENLGYNNDYIRNIGSILWQSLSTTFEEKVTKSNFRSVLRRRSLQPQVPVPPKITHTNNSTLFDQNGWLEQSLSQ